MKLKFTILLLFLLQYSVNAYRILVVYTLYGKSNSILGHSLVKHLLRDGHEITYITPFPMQEMEKLRQIDVSSINPIGNIINITDIMEGNRALADPYFLAKFFVTMWDSMIGHQAVQDLLMDTNETFDAVIATWFNSDLYSGFGAVYKCPFIWATSTDLYWRILQTVDEAPNPAYTSDIFSPYSPPLDTWQRARELWMYIRLNLYQSLQMRPMERSAYERRFGPAIRARGQRVPDFDSVASDVALVLANTHPALGTNIKLPQNVKNIGGYHVDLPPPPLPEDLKQIMDAANYGFIYFSLGSQVKSKDLPTYMKADILKVFGNLKQEIFWKYEVDDLSEFHVPENVHIRKWFPQSSILAHPNIKAFITHGGHLSTTETIVHGVPTIALPVFTDQCSNVDNAVKKGFAIKINLSKNLVSDLKNAIDEILSNSSYARNAKRLSAIYNDRLVAPGKELVYWVEHVIRTGGAHHLRSPALTTPFYQKMFLDVLGLIALIIVAIFVLIAKIWTIYGNKKVSKLKKESKDDWSKNK